MLAEMHANAHSGQAPTGWADLESQLGQPMDTTHARVLPTKRYSFIAQPLRLPTPHEGELLLIARRPFRDVRLNEHRFLGERRSLREPGRYIVYRLSTGRFTSAWVDEPYVQRAFQGKESLLPAPDTEPLRAHELEIPRQRMRNRIMLVLGLAAAVAVPILWRRALRKPRRYA